MKIEFKPKFKNKEETSLFTAFTVANTYIKLSPGKIIQLKHWSQSKQCVLLEHPNSTQINQHLKSYKADIERIIKEFKANKLPFNSRKIKIELNKIYEVNCYENDFLKFIDDFIKSNNKNRDYKLVKSNICKAFSSKEITFEKINISFINQFEAFMISKKHKTSYVNVQVKKLKQIIQACIDKKYIDNFKLFNREKIKNKKLFLYLIQNTLDNNIKIGKTTNVKERLSSLMCSNLNLKLLYAWECTEKDEKKFHKKFQTKHINREWFNLSEEDIEEIKIYFSNSYSFTM